jgi:WD40 repeat protein
MGEVKNPAFVAIVAALLTLLAMPLRSESHNLDVAVNVAELPEKYHTITGVDFSPNSSRLAVVSLGKINIWDWHTGRIEKAVELIKGASGLATSDALQFSPDGKLLAVCDIGFDRVIMRIWRTSDWSITKEIKDPGAGSCSGVAFTADGESVLYTMDRVLFPSELIVISTRSWAESWRLTLKLDPKAISVGPDGTLAAIAGDRIGTVSGIQPVRSTPYEATVDMVDLAQHSVVQEIKGDALVRAMGPLAWSPDGTRVAIAGNGHLNIFDAQSGQALVQQDLPTFGHMHVRFTADGRYFIESDMNGRGTGHGVKIWDSQRSRLLQEIPGNIDDVAVSRDGRYLAVVPWIGPTTIWELK